MIDRSIFIREQGSSYTSWWSIFPVSESFDVALISCVIWASEEQSNIILDLHHWVAVWESEYIAFIQLHQVFLNSGAYKKKKSGCVIVVAYLHLNMFIYHPVKVLKSIETEHWYLFKEVY